MNCRAGLQQWVRDQAADRHERRLTAAAVVALWRRRRRGFTLLAPLLAHLPGSAKHPKLQLWTALAQAAMPSAQAPRLPGSALAATQAWRDAAGRAAASAWSPHGRLHNAAALQGALRQRQPSRLLLLHHHDARGLLPTSWQQLLQAAQASGWQVVLSTSGLQGEQAAVLEQQGVLLCRRRNIGRCLGAYKDLVLLLQDPPLQAALADLVLLNDSTLPLQPPAALLDHLQRWAESTQAGSAPVLCGLTDSAERAAYHLQTYCLHANRALLQHPAWLRFWLGFSLAGSKDDLINNGEIGLSQVLLAAGVRLRPAYPLVQGLLSDPAMAEELQRYSIWQPRHVNQSLFAWQSLLARGFPLVKKHVLFDLIENQGLPMAMAELARWIPAERRELLAADLQQLFVSRYSGGSPEPA
jgi:hypothetical protein